MPATQAMPPVPLSFLIAVFAVAIAAAVVIMYLGFSGMIGASIP